MSFPFSHLHTHIVFIYLGCVLEAVRSGKNSFFIFCLLGFKRAASFIYSSTHIPLIFSSLSFQVRGIFLSFFLSHSSHAAHSITPPHRTKRPAAMSGYRNTEWLVLYDQNGMFLRINTGNPSDENGQPHFDLPTVSSWFKQYWYVLFVLILLLVICIATLVLSIVRWRCTVSERKAGTLRDENALYTSGARNRRTDSTMMVRTLSRANMGTGKRSSRNVNGEREQRDDDSDSDSSDSSDTE